MVGAVNSAPKQNARSGTLSYAGRGRTASATSTHTEANQSCADSANKSSASNDFSQFRLMCSWCLSLSHKRHRGSRQKCTLRGTTRENVTHDKLTSSEALTSANLSFWNSCFAEECGLMSPIVCPAGAIRARVNAKSFSQRKVRDSQ